MTYTQKILADIERHGILTTAAIYRLDIDTLLWLEKKETSK
ncbi:hypothetical protein [Lentibacter algarum]|nr:hypothetical protein [Lentibacter algarum]